jgi:PAS domain S-box-containing protein
MSVSRSSQRRSAGKTDRASAGKASDRTLAEAQLQVRARQHAIVAGLSQLALTTSSVQKLMDDAAEKLAKALAADLVEFQELEPDDRSLVMRAGVGWREGLIGNVSRDVNGQHAGLTLAAREPVAASDLRNDRRFAAAPAVLEHGAVSGIMVAIPGQPMPCGVIGVYTRQQREFSPDDVNLLRTVANIVGAAMKVRRSEQALSDAATRVRTIVTTMVDGIITIDERGIMDSVNPSAERLFGYTASELIGKNVSLLMPEPYRREHDRYIENYLRTGVAKIVGIGREVVGRRKDGTVFPMELAVSEMAVGGKRMFTGVVRDVTDRRRLEREILEAAAEEQRRIGQDLHDGLCQELAGIAFAVEVLTQKLAARSAPETTNIRKVADLVDQSITHARDLARGLQPVALEAGGLSAALEALAAKVEGLFHISCLFVCNDACYIYDNTAATHLYRIAQEAISNAVRHGKAKTVAIDLMSNDGSLRLEIRDDGIGLSTAARDSRGMGLHTMKYRAGLIGGSVTIVPGERGGTVVTCVIPTAVVQRGRPAQKEQHGKETAQTAATAAAGAGRKAKNQNPRRGRSPDRPRAPR